MLTAAWSGASKVLPPPGAGRPLAASALVGSIGYGAFTACAVLFALQMMGLPSHTVGIGTSIAGLVAVASALITGLTTDRYGARRTSILCACVTSAGVVGYGLSTGVVAFIAIQCLISTAFTGMGVAQNVIVANVLRDDDRVRFKAYQRSMRNIGLSAGALLGAIPLQLNTKYAYQVSLIVAGIFFAAGGALIMRIPETGRDRNIVRRKRATTDLPYLVTALLSGALAARSRLLTISLPLWIALNTAVPRSMIGILIFLNTAIVIVLQVPAAKEAGTLLGAVRLNTRGSFLLGASCLVFALSAARNTAMAVTLLVGAVIIFTFGEMWTSAAAWTFSYDLAAGNAGEYQGTFALGSGVGSAAGPVLAAVMVGFSLVGWLFGAAYFIIIGLFIMTTVRWAATRRPIPKEA